MHYPGNGQDIKNKADVSSGCRSNGVPSKNEQPLSPFTSLRQFFPIKEDIQQTVLTQSDNLTQFVESSIQPFSKKTVDDILEQIMQLSPLEKLLLYLKLPTGRDCPDPLKQPINPLGSRPEISQTIAWIKTHLKEDKDTSLPKQDVYNEYLDFCACNEVKPLSTADFGKVMKQVYPSVRPRRLGTRGNSRYCYSGMTNRKSLPTPLLPKIRGSFKNLNNSEDMAIDNSKSNSAQNLSVESAECNSEYTEELAFMMSSKICRPSGDRTRRTSDGDKRKLEDESPNPASKGPPERCKGKKSSFSASKKSVGGKKPRLEEECSPGPSGIKLPIPRLPRWYQMPDNLVDQTSQVVKKQKPLQPKPSTTGREAEFLESGNSLEQEEELLRYFQKPSQEEPKVSQLKMLLERGKEDKTARRRVSFETVPESPNSQKKFSFVPISPISNSPFHPPKTTFSSPNRMFQRSNSVNSPLLKRVIKKDLMPSQQQQTCVQQTEELCRSQSVPTMPQLPQITPVPSDTTDFTTDLDTDSSNLLGIDESSSSLLVDPSVDNDNLNRILNIINDMEISKLPRSYPNTPTYKCDPLVGSYISNSKSYPCTPVQTDITAAFNLNQIDAPPPPLLEGTINFFDDGLTLDCEDTFNDLAGEVSQLNSDVI